MGAAARLLQLAGMPPGVVVRPLGSVAVQETMGWQRRVEQVVAGRQMLVRVTRQRAHPLRAAGPVVG